MSNDPIYERDFSPGFLRKVLALGVRAGLHRRIPGALLPAHFAGSGVRNTPPRQRLAALVERHGRDAPGEWPGAETMDMLVEQERAKLRPDEAGALAEEWAAVRAVEVSDPRFVEHEVREWVARLGLQRALLQAADLYQTGATSGEVRALLAKLLRESDPQPSGRVVSLLDTYRERMRLWELGEVGTRVPTGLGPLDRKLSGGVRLGEFFLAMAPPKGAKTTFQVNVALNASRHHFGVLYCSFEMGEHPMLFRMDRNVTGSTKQELRAEPWRLERYYRGMIAGGAGDVVLWTGTPQQTGSCEMVVKLVEDLRAEGRVIDLVCADFLNIMGASTEEREKRHELARIGRDMSAAAKHLNVAWWSAALTKQVSIGKAKLRKNDLAEAHEVVAVVDGLVGICCPDELVVQGMRSLYLSAIREEGDECYAGLYEVDLDRMRFVVVGDGPGEQQPSGQDG